jgi:hypothetical protein
VQLAQNGSDHPDQRFAHELQVGTTHDFFRGPNCNAVSLGCRPRTGGMASRLAMRRRWSRGDGGWIPTMAVLPVRNTIFILPGPGSTGRIVDRLVLQARPAGWFQVRSCRTWSRQDRRRGTTEAGGTIQLMLKLSGT